MQPQLRVTLMAQPPLYIGSQPVYPSQSQTPVLSPILSKGELISQTRKKWLENANNIVDDRQEEYIKCVNSMLHALRTEATVLGTLVQSSQELQSKLSQTINKYNESLKLFPTKQITLIAMQVRKEDDSLADTFRKEINSFSVYRKPAPPKERAPLRDWRDRYREQQREQDQEQIISTFKGLRAGGATLRLVSATVHAGVKTVCGITPETEQVCKSTVDLTKKAVNATLTFTGTKEIVDKGRAYLRSCDGSSLVPGLVSRGFPEAQAKQLAGQSVEDVITVSTAVVTSAAVKLGVEALKKIGQFGRRSQPFATDTDYRVYKIYFTHPQLSGPSLFLPKRAAISLGSRSVRPAQLLLPAPPAQLFLPKPSAAGPTSLVSTSLAPRSVRPVQLLLSAPPAQSFLPSPSSSIASSALQVSSPAAASSYPVALSEAPSESVTGQLMNLGAANDVAGILNQVDSAIARSSSDRPVKGSYDLSLQRNIDDLDCGSEELAHAVPKLSTAAKNTLLALRRTGEHLDYGFGMTKMTDGGQVFTFKEFHSPGAAVQEAKGLAALSSFDLPNLNVAQLVAMGISGRPFTVKTHTPGPTLRTWMYQTGSAASPAERVPKRNILVQAASSCGTNLADFQTKSSLFAAMPESHLQAIQFTAFFRLEGEIGDAQGALNEIDETDALQYTDHLDAAGTDLKQNLGGVSAGFGDIHANQFSFNPGDLRPLGFFDGECVTRTMSPLNVPLSPIAEEFWEFYQMFLWEGYLAGLTFEEIELLQQAFYDAYFAAYRGPAHSAAADRFFRLQASLQIIQFFAKRIKRGGPSMQHLRVPLNRLVDEVNAILRSYGETPLLVAQPVPSTKTPTHLASEAPPESVTNQLMNLGSVNDVEGILNRVDSGVKPAPDHPVKFRSELSLKRGIEDLDCLLPELSNEAKLVLNTLIKTHGEHLDYGLGMTKITDGKQAFTLKQFKSRADAVLEAKGLTILRAFGLPNLNVARPIAIGIISGHPFLLKTHTPGETLKTSMYETGSAASPAERASKMNILVQAASSCGGNLADLQTISSDFPPLSESHLRAIYQEAIFELKSWMEDAQNALDEIGEEDALQYADYLDAANKDLEQNLGGVSAGFGDFQANQFSFDPEDPHSLGFFDADFVTDTVSRLNAPLKLISKEYWDLYQMFFLEGYLAGLTLEEITLLQQAFHDAYFAAYRGPAHSAAANRFFYLHASSRIIICFAEHIAEEGSSADHLRAPLNRLIDEVNTSLLSYAETPLLVAQPIPSASVASQLLNLGEVNDVEGILNRVDSALVGLVSDRRPGTSMQLSLHYSIDELGLSLEQMAGTFPQLSNEAQAILSRIASTYGECKNRGDAITKITDGKQAFILKKFPCCRDAVRETKGLVILRSFDLPNLALPQPIALELSLYPFLLKTETPGPTIRKWIELAGSDSSSPAEKEFALEVLKQLASSCGDNLAELQTRSSHFPLLSQSHSTAICHDAISLLEAALSAAQAALKEIDKTNAIRYVDRLSIICNKLKQNLGGVSAGFGQIHAGQFSFNPGDPRPLGFFDTDSVTLTVSPLGQPLRLISEEYWEFPQMFLLAGSEAGLTLQQIEFFLLQPFRNGYFAAYRGPAHSAAADQFYHLCSSLYAIRFIAEEIALGDSSMQNSGAMLSHLIHEVNTILLSYSETDFAVDQPAPLATLATRTPAPEHGSPHVNLTAARINEVADRHLYFPNKREILNTPLDKIHATWSHNQETLIGILGEEFLPRFAFHGTSADGARDILSTRAPRSKKGDFLWGAGYLHSVDPVTQYADLLNMVNKTSAYESAEGGMFVLDTTDAIPYGQSFVSKITPLPWDTSAHNRIFSLMERNGKGLLITTTQDGRTAILEDAFMNVDEFHVYFNPDIYDTVIKGFIPRKESLYSESSLQKRTWQAFLTNRFRLQELLIKSFKILDVVKDFAQAPWEQYHRTGNQLMSLPKESIAVPLDEFIQMERHMAQLDFPARRVLSQNNSSTGASSTSKVQGRKITSQDIGDFEHVDLRGYVASNRGDMMLQLICLEAEPGILNPQQFMDQLIHFAQQHGAKRLFIELNPSSNMNMVKHGRQLPTHDPFFGEHWIDRGFMECVQQYPVVLKRDQITREFRPNVTTHIFQVPLPLSLD